MPKTLEVKSTDFLFSQVPAGKDGCSLGFPEEVSRAVSDVEKQAKYRAPKNSFHAKRQRRRQTGGKFQTRTAFLAGAATEGKCELLGVMRPWPLALSVLDQLLLKDPRPLLGTDGSKPRQAGRTHGRSNTPTSVPVLPLGSLSGSLWCLCPCLHPLCPLASLAHPDAQASRLERCFAVLLFPR